MATGIPLEEFSFKFKPPFYTFIWVVFSRPETLVFVYQLGRATCNPVTSLQAERDVRVSSGRAGETYEDVALPFAKAASLTSAKPFIKHSISLLIW